MPVQERLPLSARSMLLVTGRHPHISIGRLPGGQLFNVYCSDLAEAMESADQARDDNLDERRRFSFEVRSLQCRPSSAKYELQAHGL